MEPADIPYRKLIGFARGYGKIKVETSEVTIPEEKNVTRYVKRPVIFTGCEKMSIPKGIDREIGSNIHHSTFFNVFFPTNVKIKNPVTKKKPRKFIFPIAYATINIRRMPVKITSLYLNFSLLKPVLPFNSGFKIIIAVTKTTKYITIHNGNIIPKNSEKKSGMPLTLL